ncbi:MAG: 16S rRNA (cytosine(1402)-N(4))-methyltransferase RsmH [bacterium]
MNTHIPVLLNEILEYLQIKPDGIYIDCTLGEGGHSEAILQKGGQIIGIEQDGEILEIAKKRLGPKNIIFVHDNFKNIKEILASSILIKGRASASIDSVNGILYDLGVSSVHFESKTRGFSFRFDADLDMRLDLRNKVTAKDLVNSLSVNQLKEIILKYGEEHRAEKIAQAIVKNRPIHTTFELIKVIEPIIGYKKIHPATKVFQALRIAVNQELDVLDESLDKAILLLKTGGRLLVISFHSLEDRLVKHKFRKWAKEGLAKIITKSPIRPTYEERKVNPRARSAKFRVIEKT